MIAATRRRIAATPTAVPKLTRRVDASANRLLLRAWPPLRRAGRRSRAVAIRWGRRGARVLRPAGVLALRVLSRLERWLLRGRDVGVRAATRASAVLTPERAICLTIVASAACLAAAQFVDYRAVEIGQPGYAGLPGASAPRLGAETGGGAHAYLLLPLALLAGALGLVVLRKGARRGLGRVVFLLGLAALAIVLAVDLPAGLDAGAEATRFSGATAVLLGGFYGELASAGGLMLGGALLVAAPKAAARYHARPCRTRTNSFARAASALRRRRRRRASSRGRGRRRGSPRRSGAESAPASPR